MHFENIENIKRKKKDKILPTPPQPSPYPTIPSSVVVKEKKKFYGVLFC